MAETASIYQKPESVTNFVFLGEAGCGKSEIAIDLACTLTREGIPVHFFDLDMTKPLFRSRDLAAELENAGVTVHFEAQFMDAPTLTGGVRRLLGDNSCYTVLDVGGDYIGARSIGGYAPLLNAPNTAVYYIMNPYRPWSGDLEHIDRVLGETLGVSHVDIHRLRLIGNPNLGRTTTPEDVVSGIRQLMEQVSPLKDIDYFTVWEPLYPAVREQINCPLVPLQLRLDYPWAEDTSMTKEQ